MHFRPLLPPEISLAEGSIAELLAEARSPVDLHPEEARFGATLGAQRAAEFEAGRRLARRLLRARGRGAPDPILVGPSGAPLWPPGIVGSITHAADRIAVALGDAADHDGIGLDLVSLDAPAPAEGVWPAQVAEEIRPWPTTWRARAMRRRWAIAEAAFKADPIASRSAFDPRDWDILDADDRPGTLRCGSVRRRGGGPEHGFRARNFGREFLGAVVLAGRG